MADILRILSLWRGRAGWLIAGAMLSVAALATALGLMTLAGATVAAALVTGTLGAPVALRALGSARVLLRYFERLTTHGGMFRALADVRVWFFRGLARGSAGGLGFRRAGDLLSRLVGDVETLDGLYLRILLPAIGAAFLLPVLVLLILPANLPVALAVGALFAFSAFVLPCFLARHTLAAGYGLAEAFSGLRIAAIDALAGLREVRAFAAEGRMLGTVQAREDVLLTAQRVQARRLAWAGAGASLCGQAALFCVLIAANANPLGAMAGAFLILAAFEAVAGLPRAGALAGNAAAAAGRVLAAANAPAAAPDPKSLAALPGGARVRFESVRFRWQPDRADVFDGLTLDIPAGARVALLGPSGSGKSTLAALALRVVAPDAGCVRLGGVDMAALAASDIRARIGWLSQATHLFDDTIRANLLLARPDADEAALWAALDLAQIGDMVRALPEQLDSWVGEGGTRFSGGQARRLALARALLTPAPLLILDEPCAGLDADTERAFLTTLNEATAGRGIILIAHRLTGVERLDRIYRLSNGRAVAAAA